MSHFFLLNLVMCSRACINLFTIHVNIIGNKRPGLFDKFHNGFFLIFCLVLSHICITSVTMAMSLLLHVLAFSLLSLAKPADSQLPILTSVLSDDTRAMF